MTGKNPEWAIKFIRKHGMGALCECGKEETPCLGCEAVAIIEKEITRKPFMNHVHACMNGDNEALKAAVGEMRKQPVDTIAVPREVLQGVRDALTTLMLEFDPTGIIAKQALTSLDAVLNGDK